MYAVPTIYVGRYSLEARIAIDWPTGEELWELSAFDFAENSNRYSCFDHDLLSTCIETIFGRPLYSKDTCCSIYWVEVKNEKHSNLA